MTENDLKELAKKVLESGKHGAFSPEANLARGILTFFEPDLYERPAPQKPKRESRAWYSVKAQASSGT